MSDYCNCILYHSKYNKFNITDEILNKINIQLFSYLITKEILKFFLISFLIHHSIDK